MKLPVLALPLVLAFGLAGCAAVSTAADAGPAASASPTAEGCAGATVVVDFGILDEDPVRECVDAGAAADALAAAGVTTEGTVEWGDQVVCRVDGRPAADETVEAPGAEPFVEACQAMPAATAYWAMWVKSAPDAEWEYAQEGIGTLQLAEGESLGLVYTTGTDSTPPGD